ncbi:MAG: hypothetical protein NTW22_03485 [Proteobacteria bacterium]|nr:hypothetical protein [Pseudomonadota bacterium]
MIKLNVGACRKVSDNHYGSRGGNVNIELELDSTLALDSQKLRDHIRKLFDLANASLSEELHSNNEPACVDETHHHRDGSTLNGNGAGNAVSVPTVRYATEKQIICIQGLARKHGVPVPELLKQAGVRVFNDMSVRQASQLIESLKGGSAN